MPSLPSDQGGFIAPGSVAPAVGAGVGAGALRRPVRHGLYRCVVLAELTAVCVAVGISEWPAAGVVAAAGITRCLTHRSAARAR